MKCGPSSKPGSSLEALFRYQVRVSSGTATLILSMLILAASAKELPQIGLVQQAEQGNAYAQFNLGSIYSDGLGVPQDIIQAYVWYDLAALDSTGENADIAIRRRDFLAEKMSGKEIAKAQQLAHEWKFKSSVNR